MTLQAPVRYAPDVETLEPDEAQTVAILNETFDTILNTTAEDYHHAVRAVHAKAHALLRGTLEISDALPPELAQGLFGRAGSHPVLLRLSTNPGDILDDSISVPRGMAIKVLDVEGERLAGAEGSTQDFIMVNGKAFQAKNAQKFAGSLKLLAKTTDRAEGAKKVLSSVLRGVNTALQAVGIESPTVQTLGGAPQVHPLGETYYSVTPFRFGQYIAKFSVAPASPGMTALTGTTVDVSDRPNGLRETLRIDLEKMATTWTFRVQLCRDLEQMPVEDPTVAWDEQESPFQTVGTIHVPAQDAWSDDRVAEIDEQTRFSVWTGLAAHQPLGNINRARRETYNHSAQFRAARNGCPIHEPVSVS